MTTTGRTIQNNFTANTGGTLTLGAAASPSIITGVTGPPTTAQTLTIAGAGKTIINDAIQEAPASGNATNLSVTASGIVNFNGVISTGGSTALSTGTVTISGGSTAVISMNAQNTYNGQTNLTGAGTIIPITISSNALPGAGFTSGPFGTGTININNGTNQHIRPIGNQSISNPILLTTGIAMENDPTLTRIEFDAGWSHYDDQQSVHLEWFYRQHHGRFADPWRCVGTFDHHVTCHDQLHIELRRAGRTHRGQRRNAGCNVPERWRDVQSESTRTTIPSF